MRILLTSNGFPPSAFGGVEVYSYDLARELVGRGNEVRVFCRESAAKCKDYEVLKGEVEGIPVIRVVNDFKSIRSFSQLYKDETIDAIFADLLNEYQPDLVHFNHLLALSATLPLQTQVRKIPSVMMLHDYWVVCQRVNLINSENLICVGPQRGADCYRCVNRVSRGPITLMGLVKQILPYRVRVILRKILRRAPEAKIMIPSTPFDFVEREKIFQKALAGVNQLIVPSNFVREILSENGYPRNRIEVVPLGIQFNSLPEKMLQSGIIRFGFIGSFLPLKGVDKLVRAFRSVKSENIRLDIYGREDIHPLFSNLVRGLASGDNRITLRGSFSPDDRAKIYSKIDVLVIPSLSHETFSMVAREALLAGVPVIAARVGALPEVVCEGVNGYLYDPMDEQVLIDLIRQIAQDPVKLETLQMPGPVEIISVSNHVDRIDRIYRSLMPR